jgi:hypothetical protein
MRTKLALVAVLGIAGCGDSSATLVDAAPVILPDSAPPVRVAPTITSFQASPSQVSAGFPTDMTFNWTFAGLPYPDPTCTIDNGVGVVMRGKPVSVTLSQITTFTLTCTNSAGTGLRPVVVTVPPVAPNIATFTTTPAVTGINVATNVMWNWTYTSPPTPAPTCSISPTVGAVTNGQTTGVTQSFGQTYTLTCMNSAGTRTRTVFLNAATAPVIATFTATPMTVTTNVATSVQFAWTFTGTPSPTATCSIDQGIGTVTSPATRTLTLAASTTYTLTCSNTGGTVMQPVTITVQ